MNSLFLIPVPHGWAQLVEAVQAQVKSRAWDLKRELQTCGVFHLSGRGEIVASHTVEVNSSNLDCIKTMLLITEQKLIVLND